MQVTFAVNSPVLNTWNLDNSQIGFVDTQVDERFNLEAITVNFYMIKTVLPEGVVAVAQVSEPRPEKHVHQLT